MRSPEAIVCEGLARRFGERDALAGVDLAVAEGETVLITGPNGAGKTTLFRVIAGEIAPEHGEVLQTPRGSIDRLAQEAPDGPESLIAVVLVQISGRPQFAHLLSNGRGRYISLCNIFAAAGFKHFFFPVGYF
jgi:ATPase subunit of ABC transporter with duplicated ATPase domains